MKTLRLLLAAMLLCAFNCGKDKGNSTDQKPDIGKALTGKWMMTGFMCDDKGKCQKDVSSQSIRMVFTKEGEYYEVEYEKYKYAVEGMTVIIKPPVDEKNANAGMYFKIARIQNDEMLIMWNYNMHDNTHTRYKKAVESAPDKQ